MPQTPTSRFFKTLASHTLIFGLSTLVRPLSQLLLVRLHTNTHFISIDDYAAWSLLQVALNIGIVVLNLGLATAFFRYYLLAESETERRSVTTGSFNLTLFIAVIGSFLIFFGGGFWSKLLIGTDGYAVYARDIAVAVFGNTLSIVPLAVLRAEGRGKLFVAFNLMRFVSIIALNAWFLIWLNLGLRGITLALAITNIATAIMILPVLKGRLTKQNIFSFRTPFLRYGAPLVAVDLTFFLLNGIPQILLRLLQGTQEVAIFGFALKIAFIAQVGIIMPFNIAFAPHLFRAQKEVGDPRPFFARTMGYIWTIGAFTAISVHLFAPELAMLLGKDQFYQQAVPIVLWLVLSVLFYGIFIVFSSGANLKDKTWVFPLILLITALIETVIGWGLIKSDNLVGAAEATLSGYIILALMTFFVNQKIYPISFPWSRIIHVTILTASIILIAPVLNAESSLWLRVLLVVSFPSLLFVSGYLDKGERDALKRLVSKYLEGSRE
ncbi:lipopolysaccharide biosynthesis protein [Calditrichota bacterium]